MSAVFRYRSGEIDYLNSDATWHTLLTIEAYNETPISQHLFLPIVSLGEAEDKGIPWGATIPDTEGNFYYTSFSPMGYFLPWLFIKIFHLSVSEGGLYIFNNLLFAISAGLFIWLLTIVYKGNKNRGFLCLFGGLLYSLLPELLHGMGIVYWHQSVLQVTLLLQIIAYYQYAVLGREKYRWLFYALAIFNSYTEWTGYVANIGFALSEVILNWKRDFKKGFGRACILALLTIAAFSIYSFHYLLRTDTTTYFLALKNRFMARNVTTDIAIVEVFKGYLDSFLYLWLLILVLAVWSFIKDKKIEVTSGILCLALAFPAVENIIMKQHAVEYTYDRMKAAWIVVFIACELIRNLLDLDSSKRVRLVLTVLVCITSILNFMSYTDNPKYIWEVSYRENNQLMADYVNEKYPDALYASNSAIRGYMNLLFGRGIYEDCDVNAADTIAVSKEKDVMVYLQPNGYDLQGITVYSTDLAHCAYYTVENGEVIENIIQ